MDRGRPGEHEGVLRRDHRQPCGQRAGHRDHRVDRARAQDPAGRGQHLRDALSVSPDRMGRRHHRALGDEIHRRARHDHRRRRRGLGSVRLVERALSGDRGAVTRLSRPSVPGDLRDLWVLHEAPRRDAPGSRGRDEPVQCVPVPPGSRDAVPADDPAGRERRGRGDLSRLARTGVECDLPGPAEQPVPTARRQISPARCRCGVLVRLPRRTGRRPGLHPRRHAVVAPGERGRLEESHHSPGQHDAPSAERR